MTRAEATDRLDPRWALDGLGARSHLFAHPAGALGTRVRFSLGKLAWNPKPVVGTELAQT